MIPLFDPIWWGRGRAATIAFAAILLYFGGPGAAKGEQPWRASEPGRSRSATIEGAAHAEASDPSPSSPYGMHQLGRDFHYLLRRPTELDRRDKLHLAVGGGTWAGLFVLRKDIRDYVQDHRSPERDRFLQDARLVSRGAVAPGLALAAYLASFATGKDREKESALMLLESAAYSAVFSAGSFVIATERPEDGDAIRFFDVDGHGVSLDAALAASIVEPLRCQYLKVRPSDPAARRLFKRLGSVALYSAASLTAYQRLNQDKHWAPDAYLGTVGGLAVGRTLCEAHGKRPRRGPAAPGHGQLSILPSPVPGGLALSVRLEIGEASGP